MIRKPSRKMDLKWSKNFDFSKLTEMGSNWKMNKISRIQNEINIAFSRLKLQDIESDT